MYCQSYIMRCIFLWHLNYIIHSNISSSNECELINLKMRIINRPILPECKEGLDEETYLMILGKHWDS